MALSEYEKQVLAQMEQELKQQDPKLASVMTSSLPSDEVTQTKLSARRIAVGSIVAIAGLAVVVIGVTMSQIWATILFGVIGFVLMVFGVMWALHSVPSEPKERRPAEPKADSGFMDRQRDRWNERGRE